MDDDAGVAQLVEQRKNVQPVELSLTFIGNYDRLIISIEFGLSSAYELTFLKQRSGPFDSVNAWVVPGKAQSTR